MSLHICNRVFQLSDAVRTRSAVAPITKPPTKSIRFVAVVEDQSFFFATAQSAWTSFRRPWVLLFESSHCLSLLAPTNGAIFHGVFLLCYAICVTRKVAYFQMPSATGTRFLHFFKQIYELAICERARFASRLEVEQGLNKGWTRLDKGWTRVGQGWTRLDKVGQGWTRLIVSRLKSPKPFRRPLLWTNKSSDVSS